VIPDELREVAMSAVATAHFYIAADGSTTVKLVKPTQNPRLNRLLMDTLKLWKFSPAMKEGKSIATEEEMVVRVQVK
jgi:protein TonB